MTMTATLLMLGGMLLIMEPCMRQEPMYIWTRRMMAMVLTVVWKAPIDTPQDMSSLLDKLN